MLSVLFSLLLFVSVTLQLMQIDFERLEQLAGFDIYNSSLRVRKYNRTAVVINGTIELMVPLNESVMVTSDLFHSSRGNQQFNHYPVKFPTQNVCEFLENFYTDYSEYVDDLDNLPAKGECPIKPCKIDILNKPFPAKAVPPFFPSGLWKAQLKLTMNDVEIARFELIIKARQDLGI
ncbi:uncharacterized protein LOC120902702 [Anopheles arabiensis]|uniref:uncharacterized protein LOC120902702 n=1 Tax=Anopheles arabiensis TaxID=7173 RepID=UPI001AAC69FB|nr:uncharacterized protein LOC120902702 [Anopheles arabiensis]